METPLTKQATGRRRCAERGGVNPAVGRLLLWGRLGMFAVESYAAAGHPAEGVESRPRHQLQMLSLAEPDLVNRTLVQAAVPFSSARSSLSMTSS